MSIYDGLKDAVSIARQADNIELYRMLLDIQKESMDLLHENNELKRKIRELEDDSYIDKTLVFKGNCYYKKDDSDYKEPYCTVCWDKNRKLIRMHTGDSFNTKIADCKVCDFQQSI